MHKPILRIQNVYGDFLRSFKVFLDRVTRGSLNKIEWNYGAKTLEYHYMMNGHESFEFPVAIIDIQDIQPVDGVSAIARSPKLNTMISNHQVTIADNSTLNQRILMDKRWVNLMFTVTINTEDIVSLLNLHDLFLGNLPQNFMFYDYKFYNYIEVTDFTRHWDFINHDIENVFLKYDPTYRYNPDVKYKEINASDDDPFQPSEERDREMAGDDYPVDEGLRYFAMIKQEPILKMTSVTKQIDKETSMYSMTINFEAQIEVPNVLLWQQEFQIKSMEIVIDTVSEGNQPEKYPILIDLPDNLLTNKTVSKGIMLTPLNFIFPDVASTEGVKPYLEVPANINLDISSVALWAVENVTDVESSRFFVPLDNTTIEYIKDAVGTIVSTRFTFKEMSWFQDFEFNQFNYLKVILFAKEII